MYNITPASGAYLEPENIYGGAPLQKQFLTDFKRYFRRNHLSQMFDKILNTLLTRKCL